MALTNSGFDGTVTEAAWANMSALADADAVESSAAWAITQGTGRQVSTAAHSGYAFARGVLSKDTSAILTGLGTPVDGQWFLICRHINWSTNAVTVVAVAHSTTSTTIPTVAPSTFPTIDNNPGVLYDQKLGWAWVRSTDTTVTLFDLRMMRAEDRVVALEATKTPRPNLILNSTFQINQRAYVSAAVLASGVYGFDRWKSGAAGTTLTFTAAPAGQALTVNSGGVIQQVVERANVIAGSYAISWAGTATARVYNVGASAPAYAASPVIVTLDGLANVVVEVTAVGSSQTVSNVKLEAGLSPTAFTRNAPSIQAELAACQRYYWRATALGAYSAYSQGHVAGSTTTTGMFNMPVPMRVAPTVIEFLNIAVANIGVGGPWAVSAITLDSAFLSAERPGFVATSAAHGLANGYWIQVVANNTTDSYVGISAEL
jgi:hypothetical protein